MTSSPKPDGPIELKFGVEYREQLVDLKFYKSGALPIFGAPQGGILWKSKNDLKSASPEPVG